MAGATPPPARPWILVLLYTAEPARAETAHDRYMKQTNFTVGELASGFQEYRASIGFGLSCHGGRGRTLVWRRALIDLRCGPRGVN